MQKEIVVVTTTDEDYLLNCYVSIFSIIKVADPKNIYRIFVLVTGIFQEDCKKLERLSLNYIFVKCIDITNIIEKFDLRETEQFPISIYYRFFIPLIFPEYKKALYLDADTCTLRDVAELYNTDLEEHVMGVVHDVPCEHLKIHDNEIGGMDCRKTFNSGVLLIDLEEFEKKKVREKCMELLFEDYKNKERKLIYPDNDVLNIVLYEKCKILDDAWNFQVQYMWKQQEILGEYKKNYQKASHRPYILHYTGRFKPWSNPDLPMANIFWKLAKETPVYDEIVYKLLVEAKMIRERVETCKMFTFPYFQIPYGSKIAIYAAGKVGQAFYTLMQFSHYADVVLWVDQNYKKLSNDFPVYDPQLLLSREEDYQYLIVAIDKKEIANEILAELYRLSIPKEKIVWVPYRKQIL